MVLVYSNDNSALVGLARGLLANAGLDVTVKNEFSATGFPPYNQRQELWLLNDSDLDRAREILAEMEMDGNGED